MAKSSASKIAPASSPVKAPPVKATTPTKVKLERFVAKVNTPKKKERSSTPLYVLSATEGIAMAFVSKPHDINIQAFTGKLFTQWRSNPATLEENDLTAIVIRRAPIVEGYNLPMFASSSNTETFYFYMFVKIFTDPLDNTVENRKSWGVALAEKCSAFSQASFQFHVVFEYHSDLTEDPLPCPNKYVLNRDVVKLMDFSYPPDQYSRQVQAEQLAEDFFGEDAATGRHLILDFDNANAPIMLPAP
jgi:hypothetical protein